MTHSETRQTLIMRALNREDEASWQEFTDYYLPFIKAVLFRLQIAPSDHDDIAQEIVLTLWKKLDYYVNSKGSFRAWLSTVTRNTTYNFLTKKKRVLSNEQSAWEHSFEVSSEPEIDAIIKDEWETFLSSYALTKLRTTFSESTITCFLQALEAKSAEETAHELKLSVETVYTSRKRVKARLIREIKNLREELEF